MSVHSRALGPTPVLTRTEGRPELGPRTRRTLSGLSTRHSACDALSASTAQKPIGDMATKRGATYSKYWEEACTERGRFGTSVDDNALGASSQQSAAGAAETDGMLAAAAAAAAGVRGLGKGGVHWGKHHHHHNHSPGSDEGEGTREPLIGDATAKLRHLYFQQKQPARPSGVVAAQRARIQVTVAARHGSAGGGAGFNPSFRGGAGGGRNGRGGRGAIPTARGGMKSSLLPHRSVPDAWAAAAAVDPSGGGFVPGAGAAGGGGGGGTSTKMRRSSFSGQGWESHTLQAQQKTDEYMQGREDLAPDMRPDVVLDNEVCAMHT